MRRLSIALAVGLSLLPGAVLPGGASIQASTLNASLPVAPAAGQSTAAITGWPAGASMLAMACPGVNVCFAAGMSVKPLRGVIAHTENGGTSWTIHTEPRANFDGIACPSATQCYVLTGRNQANTSTYAVTVTADGGKTWQEHPLPAGSQPMQLACPGATTCLLWGYSVPGSSPAKAAMLITNDGGRTWKASRTVARGLPTAARLACPTTRICYLYGGFTGTAISKSQDGGMTWRALPGTDMFALSGVPSHALANMGGIACPSASVCYTAQGDPKCKCGAWGPYGTVFGMHNGDGHWGQLYRAHGRDYPTGPITCPSVSVCYAVGMTERDVPADGIILSTKDGGRTWAAHRLPAAPLLACPSANVCYAGSYAGAVYRTHDSGATWQSLP